MTSRSTETATLGAHPVAERLVARYFRPRGGELTVGGIAVSRLAEEFGSPLYAYDAEIVRASYRSLRAAMPERVDLYFSAKANPDPEIVRLLVDLGCGVEIASGSEYLAARAAGCRPERILFAGPAKTRPELELTIGEGIGSLHVESLDEIDRLAAIARERVDRPPIACALRINPGHREGGGASGLTMGGSASAFGVDEEQAGEAFRRIASAPGLEARGVHVYIGTQMLDAEVVLAEWRGIVELAAETARRYGDALPNGPLLVGLGGGLGVPYFPHESELDLRRLGAGAHRLFGSTTELPEGARFALEPGRFLVASAGVYVAAVQSVKRSHGADYAVLDGGMHHHLAASGNLGRVVPRNYPIVNATRVEASPAVRYEVAGPLCTPLDTLGRRVALPKTRPGDRVAVLQSGAYGFTASPWGFLSRPTPAEILVDRGAIRLLREPGTFADPIGRRPPGTTDRGVGALDRRAS